MKVLRWIKKLSHMEWDCGSPRTASRHRQHHTSINPNINSSLTSFHVNISRFRLPLLTDRVLTPTRDPRVALTSRFASRGRGFTKDTNKFSFYIRSSVTGDSETMATSGTVTFYSPTSSQFTDGCHPCTLARSIRMHEDCQKNFQGDKIAMFID